MCIIYSLRECHYLKRTKIEVKLKIRIVHWVCSRSVLITMIFQYCAKIKATKSLVHKKVDRCSPWAWVGWGGADTTTAPLLSTGLSMQMSGLLVTLITTAMSKPKERVFF